MVLTVDEVKRHLRIDNDDEDALIEGLIRQAQAAAEDFCRVSFDRGTTETVEPALDPSDDETASVAESETESDPMPEIANDTASETVSEPAPEPVPEPVRLACLLFVSYHYENRDIPDMVTWKSMRMAFEHLLYPHRDPAQMF